MSSNTNWDVDKYRTEHESDEHWELRKSFMLAHKDKFSEDRLVCLAQVFTNVEFLGCRYPSKTMELVEELSKGVADDYREKQKSKLQRTFVKASDAAGAKVKGLKRVSSEEEASLGASGKISESACAANDLGQSQQNVNDSYDAGESSVSSRIKFLLPLKRKKIDGPPEDFADSKGGKSSKKKGLLKRIKINFVSSVGTDFNEENEKEPASGVEDSQVPDVFTSDKEGKEKEKEEMSDQMVSLDVNTTNLVKNEVETKFFGRMVILESDWVTDPFNVLTRSASASQVPFRVEYSNQPDSVHCKTYVNQQLVVSVAGSDRKRTREVAVAWTLNKLKEFCCVLKVKQRRIFSITVVDKSSIEAVDVKSSDLIFPMNKTVSEIESMSTRIPEDNIGNKLMKSMGWEGGGLGKTGQGIREPVSIKLKSNRAGLGAPMKTPLIFKAKIRRYLYQFARKNDFSKLLFPLGTFTDKELTVIRILAKGVDLKTDIVNKGKIKHVEVSKKYSLELILARFLQNNAGSDDNFEFHKPQNWSVPQNFEPQCLKAGDFPDLRVPKKLGCKINSFNEELENELQCLLGGNLAQGDKLVAHGEKVVVHGDKIVAHGDKMAASLNRKVEGHSILYDKHLKRGLKTSYALDGIEAGPYGSFFLIEQDGTDQSVANIMTNSQWNNIVPIRYEYGTSKSQMICKVFVNNHLLTQSGGQTKNAARISAVKEAYTKLKQICYTLKVKPRHYSNDPLVEKSLFEEPVGTAVDKPLEENVGSKLMKAMGWTGGGLGKTKQGIEEPISMTQCVRRAGLGLPVLHSKGANMKMFSNTVSSMLRQYLSKDTYDDLVFTSEFSKEERAMVHLLVKKFPNLSSKSHGKDNDRYLVVYKKKDYCQIVEDMLRKGEHKNDQYELVKPPISLSCDNSDDSHKPIVKCIPDATLEEHRRLSVMKGRMIGPAECSAVSYDVNTKSEKEGDDVKESVIVDVKEDKAKIISSTNPELLNTNVQNNAEPPTSAYSETGNDFGELVLIEGENCSTPLQIIEKSTGACHIPFQIRYDNSKEGMVCRLYVNNVVVTSNVAKSKKGARDLTVLLGLKKLREHCCTIEIRTERGEDFLRTYKCLWKPIDKASDEMFVPKKNPFVMCISKDVHRHTLGLKAKKYLTDAATYKNRLKLFLKKYMSEDSPHDLVFSPVFSNSERTMLQPIASSFGLKVHVHEISKEKYVLISKKMTMYQLKEAMLRSHGN